MRALPPILLFVLFSLARPNVVLAQQSPTNSDASSPATHSDDSPCFAGHDAAKTVATKETVTRNLLIHKVPPTYPKAARRARIQGTVVLCAVISKEGKIMDLRAVSGPPELIPSSLKAVKKWRYKPFLLNGDPVEVETDIRVNYTLTE